MVVQITSSAQAAQCDADAIASGIDAWSLMLAAGSAAAHLIESRYARQLQYGAEVYAGTGNNGGDAYVVAARLVESGARVVMRAVGEPKTQSAQRAYDFYTHACKTRARESVSHNALVDAHNAPDVRACGVVIDGVLGTGQRGALRAAEREATDAMNALASASTLVALDVPTGVNATTGEIAEGAVRARHSIAFGTMKRAHVLQRGQVGEVSVVDIGLGSFANGKDGAWILADEAFIMTALPRIEWNAYKGTRGKIALVGGAEGMAGAVVLSSRAALHAGAGLVYAHTAQESTAAMQIAVPQVVARGWNNMPTGVNAIGIGPGLGRDAQSAQCAARRP